MTPLAFSDSARITQNTKNVFFTIKSYFFVFPSHVMGTILITKGAVLKKVSALPVCRSIS